MSEASLKYEYYQDTTNLWHWRLKDRNGAVMAESSHSYKVKEDVLSAIKMVQNTTTSTPVAEVSSATATS